MHKSLQFYIEAFVSKGVLESLRFVVGDFEGDEDL